MFSFVQLRIDIGHAIGIIYLVDLCYVFGSHLFKIAGTTIEIKKT